MTAWRPGLPPDFVIHGAPLEDEGEFELDAAWKRTSKADKPYLSVKLDGPTLAQPINRALTKQPSGQA